MLDGVHTSIGDLDRLVQRDEARLQRGQLHQQLDGLAVVLLEFGDVRTALAQASQVVG